MDSDQLRQLATDAQLDHWPPHLGVRTDADKVQYLADRLREVADTEIRNQQLLDDIKTAQDRIDWLESDNDELKDKLKKIQEIAS